MKTIIVRKCGLDMCVHNECGRCSLEKIRYDEVNRECLDYERSKIISPGEWAQRIWNNRGDSE